MARKAGKLELQVAKALATLGVIWPFVFYQPEDYRPEVPREDPNYEKAGEGEVYFLESVTRNDVDEDKARAAFLQQGLVLHVVYYNQFEFNIELQVYPVAK